jgi:hypothetical protein
VGDHSPLTLPTNSVTAATLWKATSRKGEKPKISANSRIDLRHKALPLKAKTPISLGWETGASLPTQAERQQNICTSAQGHKWVSISVYAGKVITVSTKKAPYQHVILGCLLNP